MDTVAIVLGQMGVEISVRALGVHVPDFPALKHNRDLETPAGLLGLKNTGIHCTRSYRK